MVSIFNPGPGDHFSFLVTGPGLSPGKALALDPGPADGYRCLVGCSQQAGSTSSQLNQSDSMSFDSEGNINIKDKNNARV
ncbi:unnamed protein product [Adineta steineri]|uniref:Uncharacterized protein n=1 Tax=Adineta steineri TaxID=433720 RepID=A0A819FVM3_9BILA|nr:unnamed protein product [Adineta steineri]CAF3875229.1 unnamed protein product [Adineta steineri]